MFDKERLEFVNVIITENDSQKQLNTAKPNITINKIYCRISLNKHNAKRNLQNIIKRKISQNVV